MYLGDLGFGRTVLVLNKSWVLNKIHRFVMKLEEENET